MIPDPRSTLSTWTTDLLSTGRIVFDRDEAMGEIGVGHGAFLDARSGSSAGGISSAPGAASTSSFRLDSLHGGRRRRPGTSMT